VKAIALTEFGDPEVLSLQDLPGPLVGPDHVLVEVRAAAVNPADSKIRAGYLQGAFPHHTPLVPGWDVSGIVRETGTAVPEWKPGDEVIGYVRKDHVQHGTYAELVSAPVRTLARKPSTVDFATAAGLPLAGLTALQALRAAKVGEGDTVLVHAAAGGVGHLAVQIARVLGASRVIGTASERNHDFLRSLGAEPVRYGDALVDSVAEVLGDDSHVDAVVDFVGGPALDYSLRLVHEPGRIVSVVDGRRAIDFGGQHVFVRPDAEQLGWLADLVDDGELHVEVQKTFPLEQAVDAHRLLEGGHVRGKVVLTVGDLA
jgi:NADPH:quinone reductase-like Zn-dependent oxidoreductase